MKELDHRFLHHLCLTFGQQPDSDFIEKMDPAIKLWFYESWVHEQELAIENIRAQAILIGSFTNPEAAQKMAKLDNPDYSVSDEDFEKAWQIVQESGKMAEQEQSKKPHRRKRRELIK